MQTNDIPELDEYSAANLHPELLNDPYKISEKVDSVTNEEDLHHHENDAKEVTHGVKQYH